MNTLPEKFLERLAKIVPEENLPKVLQTFSKKEQFALRLNAIKMKEKEGFLKELTKRNLVYAPVTWFPKAYILSMKDKTIVTSMPELHEGKIYIQSLSSMFVAWTLEPQAGERILDLCAAPGSKTTQMADMMEHKGHIIAVEHVRNRLYKLRSVLDLLGVGIVDMKLIDGRRYRCEGELFDKVLVDAPCSSEGRFDVTDKKTFRYWSPRKIREMVRKQKGLILNAGRCLKDEGVLVYSTCTFAPEENEGVINWFLRKTGGMFVLKDISTTGVDTYPPVLEWMDNTYNPDIQKCVRILPTENMDGFFVAKLRKVKG
ncbi:MAG: RsmB/NOP family class I SAM-dependent RNA methyltransferase [Candidatus Omnitrophica bacterium]|nr:RsmB/NOP family class I SAM-dependent RNA methyltransferase [Candidatus Omnitrophota bacterium]